MRNRSVIEIMVITFTLVVAFAIVGTGMLVAFMEILDPATDTSGLTRSLTTVITLILGSLLGMLASNTTVVEDLTVRPVDREEEEEELERRGQHRRDEEVGQ